MSCVFLDFNTILFDYLQYVCNTSVFHHTDYNTQFYCEREACKTGFLIRRDELYHGETAVRCLHEFKIKLQRKAERNHSKRKKILTQTVNSRHVLLP